MLPPFLYLFFFFTLLKAKKLENAIFPHTCPIITVATIFREPRSFSHNRSEPARSRVRRGSISAPAPPKRGRGAQIFPRAKARNRGHSSSWEGPRAPHSLPRSVHPGTKKTTTLPGLRCISRADGARARRGCIHRTGALKANENRDTAIARPTVKAREINSRFVFPEFHDTEAVPDRDYFYLIVM